MNDTDEKFTKRRRTDRKSLLRPEPTDAEIAFAGFRKTVSWATIILLPIASIISFCGFVLSKVQSIVSESTKVQESRIVRLESDRDKQDERIRDLEKGHK